MENKPQERDLMARISFILWHLAQYFCKAIWRGASRGETWTANVGKFWVLYISFALLIVYAPSWDVPRILDHLPLISSGLGEWVYFHLSRFSQLEILTIAPFLTWLAGVGYVEVAKLLPYQNAFAHLGLKTPTDLKPVVVEVIEIMPGQKKIFVKAVGIALADFQAKKAALESALNLFVQDIRICEGNRQMLEFRVSNKELPKLIPFDDVSLHLDRPFSFLVGEGMSGFISTDLHSVHHMLIAGASGGGKSFFVKQLLVGLLETSLHIQLYLIDLKQGVEVKVFEKLENVAIAKSQGAAVQMLDAVAKEMDRRFTYLEKHGYTEIDCKRDKLDRIIVLVDEAAELYGLTKSSKAARNSADTARDLSDRLAKLGRVAGIHLIAATQKVLKDTIDTRIQANMNARMVFRTQTMADSMTVLGSKHASELPESKGRGIWLVGSKEMLVQTPKLDNEEVALKVAKLLGKFNGERSPVYNPMLSIQKKKVEKVGAVAKEEDEDCVNNEAEMI
jgi:S-DNA-T family DNA segregation ATPase FtsK/SpoIIIE